MGRNRGSRVFAVSIVFALLLAPACGGGGGSATPASGDAAAVEPNLTGSATAASDSAPDLALTTLDGEQVRLSDSSGKVRLVDFWATWCAPCREEVPMLNELQKSYGDRGFQVVAISEEEADVIRDFVEEHGVEYLNLVGTEEVAQAFGVLGLPAAYLLDGEGKVVKSFLGPKPRRVLVEKIESLLATTPQT